MINVLSQVFLFLALFSASLLAIRSSKRPLMQLEKEWIHLIKENLEKSFFFVNPLSLKKILYLQIIVSGAFSFLHTSILPLLIGIACAWALPRLVLRTIRRRRTHLFDRQFGEALPQIISILQAGHSFERAIQKIETTYTPPLKQEFGLLIKEIQLGKNLDEAFDDLHQRYPSRDLQMVINAVGISRKVGSNLTEALTKVSEMIAGRAALKDKVAALTAQAKIQAMISIGMPFFLAGILYLQAPTFMYPLFHSRNGQLLLSIAAVLMTIGGIMLMKISRKEFLR